MTVIYGENGTGKTGYCRILKALGFSYDPSQVVLHNVLEDKTVQSATISYSVDDVTNSHMWDGKSSNQDLAGISVFNNNCVQITLGDGRNLIVSPMGFHLFNIISTELAILNGMLDDAISERSTSLGWDISLNEGSPQQVFIKSLNSQSIESQLSELGDWTEEHEKLLQDKEAEIKGLNKDLLEANKKTYIAYLHELNSVLEKIELAETTLNEATISSLSEYNTNISTLENSANSGIKDIADSAGIEFYHTDEFQNFIKSAEAYIKLLAKDDYPEDQNEVCVYCRQDLTKQSSIELLKNYRKLLNETSQNQVSETIKLRNALVESVNQLECEITFVTDLYGIENEKQTIIQPNEIIEYNKKLSAVKKELTFGNTDILMPNFQNYISFIKVKRQDIQTKLDSTVTDLKDLSAKEEKLNTELIELKDRKLVYDNLAAVKQKITYLKVIERLEKNRNKFSTTSISRKTSEAREQLIKHDFIKIFNEELSHLRKSSIEIDLNFGTTKGTSKVQQKIKSNFNLNEVLSEGEQKAIALAEYLTELQLDKSNSPIIFDDPVNSLDHHIIEDVARRLINLSRTRQVIICTHSIILFNSILYFSGTPTFKDVQYRFYNSKNQYGVTGYITAAEEQNKVTSEIKAINALLNNKPKDRDEADVAADGYGNLRSAIELFVEHEIFQGTVKRYQKNIALTSFVKVDGNLINIHKDKLNEIFERCCGYIKGHSSPTEITQEPTVLELQNDFKSFVDIRKEFTA